MFNVPSLVTSLSKNCLSCSKYLSCKDKMKSVIYSCSLYKETPASKDAGFSRLFDAEIIPTLPVYSEYEPNLAIAKDFDIYSVIKKVVKKDSMVSPDIKIDDSDFRMAPNFLKFCTSDKYLKQKPFLEQALMGTLVFAEWCIAKGSYVISSEGISHIEELCDSNLGMHPMRTRIATSKGIEYTSHSGKTSSRRKCLTINSVGGRNITVTPEHKVQVFNAESGLIWKQAKDITIDDYLTGKLGHNLFPTKRAKLNTPFTYEQLDNRRRNLVQTKFPKYSSLELARFVGYLLTDGHIGKYRVSFINTDKFLVKDFSHCLKSLFGITSTIKSHTPYKKSHPGKYSKVYTIEINSKVFVEYLTFIGILPGNFNEKTVPKFIRNGTREEVISFIRAVFDCDGYLQRNRAGICLSNKHILPVVSLMLDNLGIYHFNKLSERNSDSNPYIKIKEGRENKNSLHTIQIRDIGSFCSIIGTLNTKRTKVLNWNLRNKKPEQFRSRGTTSHSMIKPGSLPKFKERYISKLKLAKSTYHGSSIRTTLKGQHRGSGVTLSRVVTQELKAYCKKYGVDNIYAELKHLQDLDFTYYKVTSIKDAGYHEVYDLTVPGTENFVCNGVIVHNCPRCSDSKWINKHKVDESLGELRDRLQLLVRGKCPKCKARKSELVADKELNYYYEAAIVAGQRSGKSAWIGMMSAYLTHWLLMLQNPNEIYGLMSSNILHGTFVALTYAQAKDTLWEPYYGYLTDSPFFTQYHAMLTDCGNKYGEELHKLKDTFVLYRHRKLLTYPAGPDKRTLRGRTRYLAVIDELGWFDNSASQTKVKMNANEVYIALERSLLTVRAAANKIIKRGFDNVPSGYFLNISSPSSVRDKIMELARQAQGSRKILGLIKPTWEMNPTVTREDLEEEFKKDPVAAMRDYGAQPPLTSNPFIGSRTTIEQCFHKKTNPCSISYSTKKAKDGTQTLYAYFNKLKRSGKASILAIDAGYSNNSFACAIGHLMDDRYPIFTVLVEIQPLPGIPINYSLVYTNILKPLIEKRNVKFLVADRWNSLKVLADAAEDFPDIQTEQYSLKYQDMVMFKECLQDQQTNMPLPEISVDDILAYPHGEYPSFFKSMPVAHCILQLLTIQDTGTQVIKGDQLTDDLARAMMLGHAILTDENYLQYFAVADEQEATPGIDITQMGVYKGASGGTSSKSGGMSSSQGSNLGISRSRG
jgi:intein/homing endonuclease